jgi:hypothetical protein
VQTFINSLLFRYANINWNNTLKLSNLLEIFNKDKEIVSDPIRCYCSSGECNSSTNLYERVFCDITSYIIKDKPKNTLSADEDNKIRKVINLIYNNILTNKNIQVIVQGYIDTFIGKIDKLPSKGGFNKTRKKRLH